MISIDHPRSFLYNFLLRSRRISGDHGIGNRIWQKLWYTFIRSYDGPIRTVLHGRPVVVNCGYTYPVTSRIIETFNQPIVETVHQVAKTLGRPIHFVDVGAAVGDTVLLVASNCAGDVEHYHAIDGDQQFFEYLTENLGKRSDCSLYNALLSSDEGSMQSLVRTHQGTASAQGKAEVPSTTFDRLLAGPIGQGKMDVIKIDIDGFDGRVLAGAREALKVASAVIFEWHPILYRATGNDWLEPFHVLEAAGYTNLIWFNKFGNFSQITDSPSDRVLNGMADYCFADIPADWHWDVVALKADTPVSIIDLARMNFAQQRVSRW